MLFRQRFLGHVRCTRTAGGEVSPAIRARANIQRAIGAASFAALAAALPISSGNAAEFGRCGIATTAPDAVAAALDKVLTKAVEPGADLAAIFGSAPGAVLSVAAPDWRYVKAMGVADPETGTPIDCEMPFQIGSNTKMMTAVVLLQLLEEGALGLDDPLSQHLPDLAASLPNGQAMTLRHLARHTSGIFNYTDNAPDGTPGIMEGDLTDPAALRRGYRPEELVEFAARHGKPDFPPGAEGKWNYSNTGYILLGLVIEKIERKPIGQSYKARIFDPLGMDDTFMWNDVPTPEMGLPRSFYSAPFDVETTEWNMSQGWAAGAVISSVSDMHRFVNALSAGELFHSPGTLALMQDAVPSTLPTMPLYGIGLGKKGEGIWGHGGQTLGFESDLAYFEGRGISIVGWGTSANNAMGIGAILVGEALQESGVLPDPLVDATETLRAQLVGSAWQLMSIQGAEGKSEIIESPERYLLEFVDGDQIALTADCNRGRGKWSLDRLVLTISPGALTRAACPPGSRADEYLSALGSATSATVSDDALLIFAEAEGTSLTLEFGIHR